MTSGFNLKSEVLFTSATKPASVFKNVYKSCTPNTKLIVFDELIIFNRHDLKLLCWLAQDGVTVYNRKTKVQWRIKPRIIAIGQYMESYFDEFPDLLEDFKLITFEARK